MVLVQVTVIQAGRRTGGRPKISRQADLKLKELPDTTGGSAKCDSRRPTGPGWHTFDCSRDSPRRL